MELFISFVKTSEEYTFDLIIFKKFIINFMELTLFCGFVLFCKPKVKLQNSFLCIFIYFKADCGLFIVILKAVDHVCRSLLH